MPDVDAKLAQALKQAKAAPMFFAFVAKGSADGALVVSRKAITANEIAEAKARSGGTAVFKGRCFGEDGTTVFELPKEPPGALAQQLKKIISRDAGMTLTVETRVGADEADGAEVEGQEGPTAETFKARLKEVSPVYQEAAKAPDQKPALDRTAAEAAAAYKAGDFATGLSQLGDLETASRQILDGPTPPPPQKPPIPPPPPGADKATFNARLKEVSPVYLEAGKKAPEKKADLDRIAGQAATAAKSGDFVTALSQLGSLETASKEILDAGTAPPKPATDEAAATFKARLKEVSPVYLEATKKAPEQKAALDALAAKAAGAAKAKDYPQAMKSLDELAEASQAVLEPPPVIDAATFKARMKEVLPVYQMATKKVPGSKAELDKLAADAAAAGKEHKYPEAVDLLNRLEARSTRVMRDAEVKEFKETAGKGVVEYRKKVTDWQAAKTKARAGIAALQKAILGDTEAAAEPDWDFLRSAVGRLPEVVAVFDQFDAELADALKAVDDVSTLDERKTAKESALVVVRKYRKELENPIYAILDNEAYGGIKIAEFISDELTNLAGVLA